MRDRGPRGARDGTSSRPEEEFAGARTSSSSAFPWPPVRSSTLEIIQLKWRLEKEDSWVARAVMVLISISSSRQLGEKQRGCRGAEYYKYSVEIRSDTLWFRICELEEDIGH